MGVDSTDWRFNSLKAFQGKVFRLAEYHVPSPEWDHDHCEGCWARFADYDGPDVLHEGYVYAEPHEEKPVPQFIAERRTKGMRCEPQPVVDGCKLRWVCPDCFEDFRQLLSFTLQR